MMDRKEIEEKISELGYSLHADGVDDEEDCPNCGEMSYSWDQYVAQREYRDFYIQIAICGQCSYTDGLIHYYDENWEDVWIPLARFLALSMP